MKNELIEEVIASLYNSGFTQEQADMVRNTLLIKLERYTVEKDTTELTIYEGDINENLVRKFLITKRVAGRTDRTLQCYGSYLRLIFRKIKKSCLDITTDDIRLYLAIRETRDNLSKTSLNNELRVLRTFYQYLQDEEIITVNPIRKIESIKGPKIKKEAFTEIDIERIRDACGTEREKALVEVLLSTGSRVTEVSLMRIDELQGDKIIVHGKGNKDRTVFLNAKAQLAVEKYLLQREDTNPYLFPAGFNATEKPALRSLKGYWYTDKDLVKENEPINTSSIEATTRKIGKRAGVSHVHPHRFRRTCATFALRRGMPIEQVSQMLGHEDISTTQIYLDLNEKDLEQAHKKYVI